MNIEELKKDREKLIRQQLETQWQIQGAINYVDMKIKEAETKKEEPIKEGEDASKIETPA